MFGRGNVGMLAIDESTAENAGQITLDALWVDVNDTTTLRDNIGNDARGYSVGMGVGTDAGGWTEGRTPQSTEWCWHHRL